MSPLSLCLSVTRFEIRLLDQSFPKICKGCSFSMGTVIGRSIFSAFGRFTLCQKKAF